MEGPVGIALAPAMRKRPLGRPCLLTRLSLPPEVPRPRRKRGGKQKTLGAAAVEPVAAPSRRSVGMLASHFPKDFAAMSGQPVAAAVPAQHQWSPYVMNSGTVMAICGEDFAIVAGDTRMSVGYQIQSRDVPKLLKITDRTVLATGGHCQADTLQLQKMIRARMIQYEHQNGKEPKTSSVAQLVSQMLYNRRFFPLLTKNILAGIDEDGACTHLRAPR